MNANVANVSISWLLHKEGWLSDTVHVRIDRILFVNSQNRSTSDRGHNINTYSRACGACSALMTT